MLSLRQLTGEEAVRIAGDTRIFDIQKVRAKIKQEKKNES